MPGRAALHALVSLQLIAWACARQFPQFSDHHDIFERLRSNVTTQYFTNEEMESFLHGMASECGETMALFSFGTSGAGRNLLALDVCHNPGIRDRRPFFHFIANMHGVVWACAFPSATPLGLVRIKKRKVKQNTKATT
eukprot:TRINITY_DN25976_c0_g1_i1.p2 TRINITY_DN25976_c0_g1~~TRINITY_DN25976_c0_g1_i1.p2  ORF type:complete len:138 (+),score=5.64 TRINITY_DN25976_c0_g1_i1:209-622(+)